MTTTMETKLFNLNVAGTNISIDGLDSELHDRLSTIFLGFPAGPEPRRLISLQLDFFDAPEVFRLSEFSLPGLPTILVDTKGLWASVDIDHGLGVVQYCRSAMADFEFNFGLFLAKLISICLTAEGGILFHSSGLIRDDWSCMFLAPSDGGKTTISRLLEDSIKLNDDRLAVKPVGDAYELHNTPLWDLSGLVACNAPLKRIYFLEKSDRCAITEIGPAEALRRYLASMYGDMFWQILGGHLKMSVEDIAMGKYRPRNTEYTYQMFGILSDIFRTIPSATIQFSLDDRLAKERIHEDIRNLSN